MSNEIQLALTPNLPAQPGPWQQGGASARSRGAKPRGRPCRRSTSLLRGRYLLAVVLGLMGAAGRRGGWVPQPEAGLPQ